MSSLPSDAMSAATATIRPSKMRERKIFPLLFLAVLIFIFACRTSFFWFHGHLLAGTHADEPFHYAAELVRLAPDHFPSDLSVQESRNIGQPYESFYQGIVWLVKQTGLSLLQANFVVTWSANALYIAGLLALLARLGLSPWMCALGTILATQRFPLMGQTLVTHSLAMPREVWFWPLPWFIFWFLFAPRRKWNLVLFYAVLGAVYTATYPLWAVAFGLAFGLVDLWRNVREKNWSNFFWLTAGAIVCLALVWAVNSRTFGDLGGEESALLDRTEHGRAIYFTKGFRRFFIFAAIGLWAFWQLGKEHVRKSEPLRRLWQLWAVSVAVCLIYQPLEIPIRSLSLLYLGRLSLVTFLVSMIAVAVCLDNAYRTFPAWKKAAVIFGLFLICLLPLRNAYRGRFDLSLVEFCEWIKSNTPVSALVFVPPVEDAQYFRVYAERGMWIAPYDKTTLWRTKKLYALRQERVDILKNFYKTDTATADRETTLQRLRDDGVEYIITRSDVSWAASLSWPVVHEQGHWQLRSPRKSIVSGTRAGELDEPKQDMNNAVRIGIIGLGYWGPNLLRNFSALEEASVQMCCDLNERRFQKFAVHYSNVRFTTSVQELLADRNIDAVAIATPVQTHFALAKQALEAGKHVLVEKPLTMRVDHAEELIALAAAKGLVLQVDHVFVYSPAVTKIKEIMDAGKLGQLLFIDSVRINLGLFQHDVNVIWDLAPHDLSIVDYLVGRMPRSVSAFGRTNSNHTIEDVGYLNLDFEGGLIANFHVNWLSPVKIRHMLFGGSEQSLLFNDLDASEKIKVFNRGVDFATDEQRERVLVSYRSGDIWSPNVGNAEPLSIMAQDFVRSIREGKQPLADGRAGARVVKILEAAQLSIKDQGRRVTL